MLYLLSTDTYHESYRHQLNHAPKQVYRCDYPGCTRQFVRLDLRNRHRDRHTAKGSALNRKDSLAGQVSPVTETKPQFGPSGPASTEANRPVPAYSNGRPTQLHYRSPQDASGSQYSPPAAYASEAHPNGVDYMRQDQGYGQMHMQQPEPTQGPRQPAVQTNVAPYSVLSPGATQHDYQSHLNSAVQSSSAYATQNTFPPFALPPSDFATTSTTAVPRERGQSYTSQPSVSYTSADQDQNEAAGDMMLLQDNFMPNTMPVFGTDSILNKSPYFNMPEDFVTYLFNSQQGEGSPISQHVMAPSGYSK